MGGLSSNDTLATSNAAHMLLNFMGKNLLSQFVTSSTRTSNTGTRNILDLYIANYDNEIHSISTQKTPLSDHDIVSIGLSCDTRPHHRQCNTEFHIHSGFRAIDYENADYNKINSQLQDINWDILYSFCESPDDFSELFHLTILQICSIHTKPKLLTSSNPSKNLPLLKIVSD